MRLLMHVCCAVMVAGIAPAFAQNASQPEPPGAAAEAPPVSPGTDLPPSRVGRVSLVSGNFKLRGSVGADWVDGELNQPVFTGEALRTGPRSRGEIEIGANTIWLSDGSEIEITSLRDRVTQISLAYGRMALYLRRADEDESVGISIPQGVISLLTPGSYDIGTGSGELPSQIAVFDGKAQLVGADGDLQISAGHTAVLKDTDIAGATVEPATRDAFAEWCRERDYRGTRLAAPSYISPEMTGVDALDAGGIWKINPDYGPVWFPITSEEWAPYRFGHWSWVPPWDWTWIDDQPWGFAPSHYGRWVLIDDHWAWAPGSFVERPLYAPAVVAFLGTPGVGLSSEEGATIAWFPLAPGEAYWPSYARDVDYVRGLNRGNVQDVGTIHLPANGEPPLEVFDKPFANRQYATVVPRPVFINGRPAAPARMTLPEQRLQNAPVLMASPQLAPASAQHVARVATPAVTAPPRRLAVADVSRRGRPIRAALFLPRGRSQPLVIRGAHLRVPSYAGSPHGRQMIVVHIAQPRGGGRRAHG
jgi:hypothetical protein